MPSFYVDVAIKLAIGLLSLAIVINISGKGNLAPTSASDQIQNYVLGGIIGGPIYNSSISVLQYSLILIIWCILILVLKWIKTNNLSIKKMLDGGPILIINQGKLVVENCRKAGLNAHDVAFKLRSNNIYYVHEVKRAILEQNGQFIIVKYGEQNPKFPIITDGQVQKDVLDVIGKDEAWLEETLQKQGHKKIKDIFLAEYEGGDILVSEY
jgi:hypothetical protein